MFKHFMVMLTYHRNIHHIDLSYIYARTSMFHQRTGFSRQVTPYQDALTKLRLYIYRSITEIDHKYVKTLKIRPQ